MAHSAPLSEKNGMAVAFCRQLTNLVRYSYDDRDFTFLRPPRNSSRTTGVLCPTLGLR